MSPRPKFSGGGDANHMIPRDFLRDRCGGFEAHKIGNTISYTANFRGHRILLIDLSKYGGVLTDWIIECLDKEKMFWLEVKTPEAFKQENHDMTQGELWLYGMAMNFRFVVADEDMFDILDELTS